LWAENYPPYAHNLLMEVEERALREIFPAVRGKRVLDLASGTGRYARVLDEQGARVTALDFSYEMLMRADMNLTRTQGDMSVLPFASGAFEMIVCGLAVGHVANLPNALQEMARTLRRGGTLLYSDFHAGTQQWQRTFRSGNQTFAVKHHARSEQEHAHAIRSVGLLVDTLRVVHISPELARADARAENFRAQWGDTPVALVVRAQKM
jgi:malonyl-CoA O-methyltransferase